jgi:hypothetical protein
VNPSGSGYLIEECLTGDIYRAVLSSNGVIGQVFSSVNNQQGYDGNAGGNLACYTIIEQISGEDGWDYANLPILALPFVDYGECSLCELWIQPKIWSTTPENWSSGPDVSFRTWAGD